MSTKIKKLQTSNADENEEKSFLGVRFYLALTLPVVIICAYLTLTYFIPRTTVAELFDMAKNYDHTVLSHFVVTTIKIPRILGAIIVGAGLAVGGAIMQGITRNYLADPSIVGVNSGAGLGISIAALVFKDNSTYIGNVFFSLIGATISTVMIFYLSSRIQGRDAQTKLLLAGSALGGLFSSLSSIINLYSGMGLSVALWNNSGLLGIKWISIGILMLSVLGIIIGFGIAGKITVLGLGEETAIGLGENVKLIKALGIAAVVLIASATVSTVGSIGFIGLIIPNMVKMKVGADYNKIIPLSAIFGSALLVTADVLSRLIHPPFETPVGTITSVIGIPIFIYLINYGKRGESL